MSGSLVQRVVEGSSEVRTRQRDPQVREREEQLAALLKSVKVYVGGLPVNMDEILVSGVKALDPNNPYHTEIVEKVKRQAVRVLVPEVERTSTAAKSIKEITERLQEFRRAMQLSADDIIRMRLMFRRENMTYEDIGRFMGLLPTTVEQLLAPKKSVIRSLPQEKKLPRTRKLGL